MVSQSAPTQVHPGTPELRHLIENVMTKADLANFEARFIKRMLGALMVQTAVIVALVKLLP